MYADHRTATTMQAHRAAELRRLAERRRAVEDRRSEHVPTTEPEPVPAWFTFAGVLHRLGLRPA